MKCHFLTLALFLTAVMSIGATPISLVKNERSAMKPFMKMIRNNNNCGCGSTDVGQPCPGYGLCNDGICSALNTCDFSVN
uniref:Venom peptide Tsp9.2ii n=1 Tax=Turris spectabilis TaxID=439608 RepID=A0A976LYB2_9CAEN|nr:venom peptide precursor Tsp9.2ii [Turris spectabilis]